jgi:hypothetical protein
MQVCMPCSSISWRNQRPLLVKRWLSQPAFLSWTPAALTPQTVAIYTLSRVFSFLHVLIIFSQIPSPSAKYPSPSPALSTCAIISLCSLLISICFFSMLYPLPSLKGCNLSKVRVRVSACSLNPVDAKVRCLFSILPSSFRAVLMSFETVMRRLHNGRKCRLTCRAPTSAAWTYQVTLITVYHMKSVSKVKSGVIDAVGEHVQGWAVGDAVLYHGVGFKPASLSYF